MQKQQQAKKSNNKKSKKKKEKEQKQQQKKKQKMANEHFKINAKLLSHDAVCGCRRCRRRQLCACASVNVNVNSACDARVCGLRNYIRYLYVKWPDGRRVALYSCCSL